MSAPTVEVIEEQQVAGEVSQIANLPAELAVLKMENDNMMSLAAARPRDHKTILADIKAQLDAYPSFAKAAVYTKPVGKDPDTGQMRYARGLSVRAAEAIAEAYGYCRIKTDVSPIDADTVKVTATFVDYQKGRVWEDSGILSKWYTSKYKKAVKHNEDRFYNVIVKAEVSRRVREVITRSVPPGLRSELMLMADRKAAELLDDKAITSIIDSFKSISVTLKMLEDVLGNTYKNWTSNSRIHLVGLWTAISDGETTVAEAFAEPEKNANDKTAKPPKKKGAKASDLSNPKLAKSEGKSEQLADQLEKNALKAVDTALNGKPDKPDKAMPAFELFKAEMRAAPSREQLTETKNDALAESQQGLISIDEWKELQALFSELSKSFGEKTTGAA